MTSYSRLGTEGEHDLGRSATFPLPADRRASQSLSRNQAYRKGLITQRRTSPVRFSLELRSPSSLKSKKTGVLKKHVVRTPGTTLWPATSKRSDTPVTDKKNSTTYHSSCGNDDDINFPTPRWTHRSHRKGKEDKDPSKTRQWLVSAINALVFIYAWLRISALVEHPPRDGDRPMRSLLVDDGVASVVSAGNYFDRRAGGVRKSLFSGENEGIIHLRSGMAATTRLGDNRTVSHGGGNQHPDLSLLNPRALEMVAADMGHLRNTIEQLENVLKESMGKHGKDISLVMHQLGVFVDMSPPDTSQLVEEQRRVSLLSERRAGAGTGGKVFNADPNIFYVGDPYRMGGGPEALFGGVCSMMVSRLLACQPTIDDVRNLYSISFIVEQVVPRVSRPELSVKFLLFVRDPRAALPWLSQSWERSKYELDRAMSKDCTQLAATICPSAEKKLESLIDLGNDRFRVLKYETAAATPFAMTKSIYAWLDLGNLPEEASKALMNVSTEVAVPPRSEHAAEKERRATLARFDWVTRWAVEMPDFRRHQIQRACKPLLASLGYEGAVGIGQRPGEIVGDGIAAADGVSSSDDSSGALDAWYGFVQVAAKVTAATSNTVPAVPAENVA